MSSAGRRDVIIVGAGVNGLVAAGLLAKAGFRPLVLERRAVVGGTAVTEEFHPGFRASMVASTGPILPGIARALDLRRHGFDPMRSEVRMFAPSADGRALPALSRTLRAPPRSSPRFRRKTRKDSRNFTRASPGSERC